MSYSAFEAYFLAGGHAKVAGWVAPGALTAMHVLMTAQETLGVKGQIGEIGVHHGRYFLALAALSRPEERLVAVDVFEDQHLNIDNSGKGDREQFLANVAEHGPAGADQRLVVIKADSIAMRARDLLDAAHGRFRFFSVDGGHTVRHVLNDVALAEETLVDGGIISVDDFFNLQWPGIAEGLVRYAKEHPTSLVPLFYGDNKIYLTQKRWAELYWPLIERALVHHALQVKRTEFLDTPVAHVRFKAPEAVLQSGRADRTEIWTPSSELKLSESVRFVAGWTRLAPMGRWSVGEGASLEVTLPERAMGLTGRLDLSCYAYTRAGAQREVTFYFDDHRAVKQIFTKAPVTVAVKLPPVADGRTTIRLEHVPVGSPRDNDGTDDERTLGVLLSKIAWSPLSA